LANPSVLYTHQPIVYQGGAGRTVEIIPKPEFFRKGHIPVRNRRRKIILSAAVLSKENVRHALEVHNRASHGTRDDADGFEAGVRICDSVKENGERVKEVGQPVSQKGNREATNDAPTLPAYDTRPCPGLNPKMPQYPDGMRMLPPASEPTPSTAPSAARSAPSPPEEPPAVCAADHGLHVQPQSGFAQSKVASA